MAKQCKPRDIGTPTVIVRYIEATPEQVEQFRESRRRVIDQMYSEIYGKPMHMNVDFGETPLDYGKTRVLHPDVSV